MLNPTYTLERKQEIRDHYQQTKNAAETARALKVPVRTVQRFCSDKIEQVRGKTSPAKQALNEKIIALRKAAKSDPHFRLTAYVKTLGITHEAASKALRGHTFKHLDDIEAPVIRDIRQPDQKKKARALYAQDMTILEIQELIHASASAIADWCSDLIQARHKQGRIKRPSGDNPPFLHRVMTSGPQILTDDNVITIRKEVRETGVKGWRVYAERYGTGISVISTAARGITFTHLNDIAPPVEDKIKAVRHPGSHPPRPKTDEALVTEAIAMRHADPDTWGYGELAEWMREKTGRNYQAANIAGTLRRRDPSLKALEVKGQISEEKRLKREENRKSLRLFMAAENQRDRDIAAMRKAG